MSEKNNGGISSKFPSDGKENPVQNEGIQSQNVDNQTVDKANQSQSGTTQTPDASFLTRIHQALTTAWSRMKRLFCCAKCSTSSTSSNNSSVSTSSLELPELKVRYEKL